jgi:hypothetical protein
MADANLIKRYHWWNFRDENFEPPSLLSNDLVEPTQEQVNILATKYGGTKAHIMEWG